MREEKEVATLKSDEQKLLFVIQQHAGRSMHYDFRLEYGGKLISWAIPKGPSTNPSKKQLAIKVNDHPLPYASFEGIIPEGHYGAGPVIVWDRGTYTNLKKSSISSCEKKGIIEVWLDGEKLKGGYALIHAALKDKDSWLFVKMKDEYADPSRTITQELQASVVSGKTIEDMRS